MLLSPTITHNVECQVSGSWVWCISTLVLQSLKSVETNSFFTQDLLPAGEIAVSFELTHETATQSIGKLPTRSPVSLTFFYPVKGEVHPQFDTAPF